MTNFFFFRKKKLNPRQNRPKTTKSDNKAFQTVMKEGPRGSLEVRGPPSPPVIRDSSLCSPLHPKSTCLMSPTQQRGRDPAQCLAQAASRSEGRGLTLPVVSAQARRGRGQSARLELCPGAEKKTVSGRVRQRPKVRGVGRVEEAGPPTHKGQAGLLCKGWGDLRDIPPQHTHQEPGDQRGVGVLPRAAGAPGRGASSRGQAKGPRFFPACLWGWVGGYRGCSRTGQSHSWDSGQRTVPLKGAGPWLHRPLWEGEPAQGPS